MKSLQAGNYNHGNIRSTVALHSTDLTYNESVVHNKLFTEVKLNTNNNANQYLG
jgi:hypothetical protein